MLELKNIIELKNSMKQFNKTLKQAEERTNELKDKLFEIIQPGEKKSNEKKKYKESLGVIKNIKQTYRCIMGISDGKLKEKKAENLKK